MSIVTPFSIAGFAWLIFTGSSHLESEVKHVSVASAGSDYTCKPRNKAAKVIGKVIFNFTDDSPRQLMFTIPEGWPKLVKLMEPAPLQDPPHLDFQWVSDNGQKFFGQLNWRDDTTVAPATLGVVIGSRGNEILWANWSCKVN